MGRWRWEGVLDGRVLKQIACQLGCVEFQKGNRRFFDFRDTDFEGQPKNTFRTIIFQRNGTEVFLQFLYAAFSAENRALFA